MFSLLSKCRTVPKSSASASKLVVQARHLPHFAPYSSHMIHANDRLFCPPIFYVILDGPCSQWMNGPVLVRNTYWSMYLWKHANLRKHGHAMTNHYHLLSGLIIHNVKTPMNDMPLNLNPKRIRPMDTTPTRHQLRSGPQMVQTRPPRCSSKQVSQCPIATAQNGMKPCILSI